MGKTLLILRHGKSDWSATTAEADFDRPLAKRGIHAATLMGQYLAENELTPDVIYTSPAKRAASTAELVQAELLDVEVVEDERIYTADADGLVQLIRELPDDSPSVMLVGHNPILEELVDELTGRNDTVLKTCSLAIVECDADSWADVEPGEFTLESLVHPAQVEE